MTEAPWTFLAYHERGKPIPPGWKVSSQMQGSHHGARYDMIELIDGATGLLDADPPAAGAPEHAHVNVTPDGRLCSFGGGQSVAMYLDKQNLLRLAGECIAAAMRSDR